jgi:predicted O-methyltransferase YrrM
MKRTPYARFAAMLVSPASSAIWMAFVPFLVVGGASIGVESEAASPKLSRPTQAISTTASSSPQRPARRTRPLRKPDVIYYSTPQETVTEMLRMARIKEGDVLYDLGSGDGRIPIAAAHDYGIRAVGIEIDPKLITQAEENARRANVSSLVSFRNDDMFRTDLREATVVTLYLSEKLNVLLRPKLLRELRPGTRIVSHDFRMGDWQPEQTVRVPWGKLYRTVYLWTVPERRRVAGKSQTRSA